MARLSESRVARLLLGDDIFISYPRSDGATYAAGLASRLTELHFACRLDQWGTSPGGIPPKMLRALRRSSMLVVIGTRGGLDSDGMKREITEFLKTGREIIPIDVDNEIEKASWWEILEGLPVTKETIAEESGIKDPKTTGEPSTAVVNRIDKTFTYRKKDQRFRRMLGVMFFVFAILGGAAVFEGKKAIEELAAENTARRSAESARIETQRQSNLAAKAEIARQTAERLASKADDNRNQAELQEKRAKLIAAARSALSTGDPIGAVRSAEGALAIADGRDGRLLIAEAHNRGVPLEIEGLRQVKDLVVSPTNANLIVAIGTSLSEPGADNELALWDVAKRRTHRIQGRRYYAITFAPDGRSVFAVVQTGYQADEAPGLDRRIRWFVSLVQYDLSLDVIKSGQIRLTQPSERSGGTEEWDVREIEDLRFDDGLGRLLMAGFAAPASEGVINNPAPRPFRGWAKIGDLEVHGSIDTENELSSFNSYRGKVVSLDRDRIVYDGIQQVYTINMSTGERTEIGEHTSPVNSLAASPSGKRIAAVGDDGRVSIFEEHGGKWSRTIHDLGGEAGIDLVVFIDDQKLAFARTDLSVVIYSLEREADIILDGQVTYKGSRQKILSGHTARITDLSISPNRRWIVSASEDKTVRLWSVNEDSRRVLEGNMRGVSRVRFNADSSRVYAGGLDGIVRVYETEPSENTTLPVHPDATRVEDRIPEELWREGGNLTIAILRQDWGFVHKLEWNENRTELTAHNYDESAITWDARNRVVRSVPAQVVTLADVNDKRVRGRWAEINARGELEVHFSAQPTEAPRAVVGVFSPRNTQFVQFSYEKRRIYIWDLKAPKRQPWLLENVYGDFARSEYGEPLSHAFARFSPGGKYLAFPIRFEHSAGITVIDLSARRVRIFSGDIEPQAFDISEKGDLAIGGRGGNLQIYSLRTDVTREFPGHAGPISAIAFSPEGDWVATASEDRTVRLWAAADGEYSEFRLLNPVEDVTFSRDGCELFAAAGRAVHSWYVPSNKSSFDPSAELLPLPKTTLRRPSPGLSNLGGVPQSNNLAFLVYGTEASSKELAIRASIATATTLETSVQAKLMKTIEDSSATNNARFRAALELGTLGEQILPLSSRLAAALPTEDEQSDLTRALLYAIGRAGPKAEVTFLEGLQTTKDAQRRYTLVQGAIALYPNSTRAQSVFKTLVADPSPPIRLAVALALTGSLSDAAERILSDALFNGDPRAEEAAKALEREGPRGVPDLIRALDSPVSTFSERPSELATKALVAMGPVSVEPLLVELRRRHGLDRISIVRALGEIGPSAAIATVDLIAILKEDYVKERDYSLVQATVRSLGEFKSAARDAAPLLVEMLLHEDRPDLDASYALRQIGPSSVPDLVAAMKTKHGMSQWLIADTLGEFGSDAKPAVAAISAAIWTSGPWSSRVVEDLGKIGPSADEALPQVIRYLEGSSGFDRAAALKALGGIKSNAALSVPAIVTAIETESQSGPVVKYRIDPDVLSRLAESGMSQSEIAKLETLHDGIARERGLFLTLVARRLTPDEMAKYQELVLRESELRGDRDCDEFGIYREAVTALSAFGEAAARAVPTLRTAESRLNTCRDIKDEIEKALSFIGKPTTVHTPAQ
jgi:WD40 repeat protein